MNICSWIYGKIFYFQIPSQPPERSNSWSLSIKASEHSKYCYTFTIENYIKLIYNLTKLNSRPTASLIDLFVYYYDFFNDTTKSTNTNTTDHKHASGLSLGKERKRILHMIFGIRWNGIFMQIKSKTKEIEIKHHNSFISSAKCQKTLETKISLTMSNGFFEINKIENSFRLSQQHV